MIIYSKTASISDWNRLRWAVLGLSQDEDWTDFFEIPSVNSLKGDLSNETTVNPPLFSLVNTFIMTWFFFRYIQALCGYFVVNLLILLVFAEKEKTWDIRQRRKKITFYHYFLHRNAVKTERNSLTIWIFLEFLGNLILIICLGSDGIIKKWLPNCYDTTLPTILKISIATFLIILSPMDFLLCPPDFGQILLNCICFQVRRDFRLGYPFLNCPFDTLGKVFWKDFRISRQASKSF